MTLQKKLDQILDRVAFQEVGIVAHALYKVHFNLRSINQDLPIVQVMLKVKNRIWTNSFHILSVINFFGWYLFWCLNTQCGNLWFVCPFFILGPMLFFPFCLPSFLFTVRTPTYSSLTSLLSPNINCTHYDVIAVWFCREAKWKKASTYYYGIRFVIVLKVWEIEKEQWLNEKTLWEQMEGAIIPVVTVQPDLGSVKTYRSQTSQNGLD